MEKMKAKMTNDGEDKKKMEQKSTPKRAKKLSTIFGNFTKRNKIAQNKAQIEIYVGKSYNA
jgi:hypothetical protein